MRRLILVLLIAFTVISHLGTGGGELKYPAWKDTAEAFGDGTYQVLHQSRSNKDCKLLTNCKYNVCLVNDIEKYEKIENYVYFKGKNHRRWVYCKLNIENNLLLYYIEDDSGEELICDLDGTYHGQWIISHIDEMTSDGQIKIINSFDEFSQEDAEIFNRL